MRGFNLDQLIQRVMDVRLRDAPERFVQGKIEQLVENEIPCQTRIIG